MDNGDLTKARLTAALKPKLATDALLISDANPTYTAYCDSEGFYPKGTRAMKPSTLAKVSASMVLSMCKTSTLTTVGSNSG